MVVKRNFKKLKERSEDEEAGSSRQRLLLSKPAASIEEESIEEDDEDIDSEPDDESRSADDARFTNYSLEDGGRESSSEAQASSALSADEEDEAFSDSFEDQLDGEEHDNDDMMEDEEESEDEAFDEESCFEDEEDEMEDQVPSSTKEMIEDFSSLDLQNQKKAEFIVAQQEVAEHLVELRVLMEEVVTACNQLPQQQPQQPAIHDPDTLALYDQAHQTVNKELKILSSLQRDFFLWNPDTAHVVKEEKSPEEEGGGDQQDGGENLARGKRKLEDVSATLAKRLKLYRTYRDEVIDKYDTYAASKVDKKSFASFEEPTTKNIERALQDMPNLVKRTQLPRTSIKVVGKPEVAPSATAATTEGKTDEELMGGDSQPQHDPEIFDDNDFYHLLLRCHQDLLASKSKNSDTFRKCQEVLERLRKKLKKKVDTRASKGRKIRYNVHQKLVHFLRPAPPKANLDLIRNSVYKMMAQIPK